MFLAHIGFLPDRIVKNLCGFVQPPQSSVHSLTGIDMRKELKKEKTSLEVKNKSSERRQPSRRKRGVIKQLKTLFLL